MSHAERYSVEAAAPDAYEHSPPADICMSPAPKEMDGTCMEYMCPKLKI